MFFSFRTTMIRPFSVVCFVTFLLLTRCLLLLCYYHYTQMDNSVSRGKFSSPGKHGFSFGGSYSMSTLAALSLLAANLPDITDEPTPAVYPVAAPLPDFAIPPSLGVETDPFSLDRPCSPVGDANGITFEEVCHLLETPGDGDELQEVDNSILLPDDTLFDLFRRDNDTETFQNGFEPTMFSHGRYFHSYVNTASRRIDFEDKKMWDGPSPAFHALPYSWAHRRQGSRHHLAEVVSSTNIVAKELRYPSAVHYVKARGWTYTTDQKLRYRQISEIIFRHAQGDSNELHQNFHAMVKRLYNFIEKQGLKDPLTGKPSVDFMKESSFTSKLHRNAQEYQQCVIIVEKFFLPYVSHHKEDVEYWVIEIFRSCRKHNDLIKMIFHIHSIFPNGDDPVLAMELLQQPEAMRDAVFHRADALAHAIQYSNMLEAGLNRITRKTQQGRMPSQENTLLFARARARDWARAIMKDEDKIRIPTSTIQPERQNSRNSRRKRNVPGKFVHERFVPFL